MLTCTRYNREYDPLHMLTRIHMWDDVVQNVFKHNKEERELPHMGVPLIHPT